MTTFDYSKAGLLLMVKNPDASKYTLLAYGAYDQVTSAIQFPDGYTLRFEYGTSSPHNLFYEGLDENALPEVGFAHSFNAEFRVTFHVHASARQRHRNLFSYCPV